MRFTRITQISNAQTLLKLRSCTLGFCTLEALATWYVHDLGTMLLRRSDKQGYYVGTTAKKTIRDELALFGPNFHTVPH